MKRLFIGLLLLTTLAMAVFAFNAKAKFGHILSFTAHTIEHHGGHAVEIFWEVDSEDTFDEFQVLR
ncbi:MAG: hypothetical protein JXR56_04825, partial [Candidatus Cloacimonetes bacterium]|nr:hypothetical protein [Candidatus Cloacimonadota bacterium]